MFNCKKNISKLITAITVSSCMALYLIFFVPAEIFISNPNEFNYLLGEIIPYLLLSSFILAVVITSIIILLNQDFFNIALSLVTSLIILLWLEGNVFYKDYGPLDGGQIIWDKWSIWGYINIFIWLGVISISIYYRNYIFKFIRHISIILILSFSINFIIAYEKLEHGQKDELIFDESTIANFSSDKNIIVLVLDEVQSDIFYEIIKEDKYYKNIFDGFVYYPDAVSGYPFTVPSIPLILSGQYYDNTELFSEYVKRAYLENSFLRYLVDANFKVELYPKFYDFNYYKSNEIATNIIRKGDIISHNQAMGHCIYLLDLALFKSSPHILKKYIYNNNEFILSKKYSKNEKNVKKHIDWFSYDYEFVNKIVSNSKLIYSEPAFKFFHLRGAHAPWHWDDKGNYLKGDGSRKNYKDHVIYKLNIMNQVFNKFKKLGIYDDSTIYIISDHGAGRTIETKLKTDILDSSIAESENINVPYQVKARAISLFLKKLANSKGKMQISNRSFANSDFSEVVKRDLEIASNQVSRNSIQQKHSDGRRYFYYSNRSTRKYLPWLYEYIINGNSWLDSSWTGPINIYTETGVYKNVWSVEFNGNSKYIFQSIDKTMDGIEFIDMDDNEFQLNFRIKNFNNLLLNIVLNYRDDIKRYIIEMYINENKIKDIKTADINTFFDEPYKTILIKEDHLNHDNNVIKLLFRNSPHPSFADVIDSIGLYELDKKQIANNKRQTR